MATVRLKAHIHLLVTKQWRCSNYAVSGSIAGHGKTPLEAYNDWWNKWLEYNLAMARANLRSGGADGKF